MFGSLILLSIAMPIIAIRMEHVRTIRTNQRLIEWK